MEERLISRLEQNLSVINDLLNNRRAEAYFFKPDAESWSMIQVLSHLVDEEVLDFRARLFAVLDDPHKPLTPYDPQALMNERTFTEEDYNNLLDSFMDERLKSVAMLRALDTPNWDSQYTHPKLGVMTARLFLTNWVAHDYIHIQQLNRLAYQYLESVNKIDLSYAGRFRIG